MIQVASQSIGTQLIFCVEFQRKNAARETLFGRALSVNAPNAEAGLMKMDGALGVAEDWPLVQDSGNEENESTK